MNNNNTTYKDSPLGKISNDWEVKRHNEISRVVRGGSPRPAGDPKYFKGSFIPWLTVASLTAISDAQTTVTETEGFLTEEGSKLSRKLEKGTLILANSGATLGVAKILGIQCCANDGIAAFIEWEENTIDKLYALYFLNTKTKYFRDVVAPGNGQPNLNTDLIGIEQICFPPLP
jgi:type I restriction enzyme, S subunit